MLSFKNFYKPAPADVQRYCAALKGVGGLLTVSTLAGTYAWVGGVGLGMCVLAESWEKLRAAPAPAAAPDPATDPSMKPEDVEPENAHA